MSPPPSSPEVLPENLGKELWQDGLNSRYGTEDNPKDLNKAIWCFRKAIRVSGDAYALDNLADIFRQRGLRNDVKKAIKLEKRLFTGA
jgi:hypothetical protein